MSRKAFFIGGLFIAVLLVFGVSRYASSAPDGLEKVAADKELDSGEKPHALSDGPFADYETRGVEDSGMSTGVAGLVGVVITFVIAGGLVGLATRASRRPVVPDDSRDDLVPMS